jgi:hypothetical protein
MRLVGILGHAGFASLVNGLAEQQDGTAVFWGLDTRRQTPVNNSSTSEPSPRRNKTRNVESAVDSKIVA